MGRAMTPIERAAQALWEISGRPYKAHDNVPAMSPPEDEPDWEQFLPQARAVMQAIREPSEEMFETGAQEIKGSLSNDGLGPTMPSFEAEAVAIQAWQAMIDAALTETKGREP